MTVDGETMESVTGFIYLNFKITVDSDFSHEIKIHLLFAIRAMTNLASILKKKRETLLCQQALYNQSYGFLVVMYGCESWTIKKAEH
jgi:hypothetical protein